MRKLTFLILLLLAGLVSCKQETERGIPGPAEVAVESPDTLSTPEEQAEKLKSKGHQIFFYKDGDTTYLMQQYYVVFLKSGKNRSQDSTEAAELQKQHLAHFTKMAEEGYLSLVGPFESEGDIRGIAIYNTPTEEMADSLARLDPMVAAGRLEVEIHPWWAAKGGKLK
ncbi:YciI family protein [Salinimicrobium gaetbulicola]|uniref:YciI family protein n=1 Tax=Salinimicrobium gaetbulicola TaxID=999702 RepID=A0ABW3IH34_9FLAO